MARLIRALEVGVECRGNAADPWLGRVMIGGALTQPPSGAPPDRRTHARAERGRADEEVTCVSVRGAVLLEIVTEDRRLVFTDSQGRY
jgi:hypothetical protein